MRFYKWMIMGLCLMSLSGCADDGDPGSQGEVGEDGEDGENGAPGTPGEPGEEGLQSLVTVVAVLPGEACQHGGQRLSLGLDLDRDGTLSSGEVTSETHLCAGAPGEDGEPGEGGDDGAASLLRLRYELAGEVCVFGGYWVETGVDGDGDGELSDVEVVQRSARPLCHSTLAYTELAPLPMVQTVWSFSLTARTSDGSPRLGFMFTDPTYRSELIAGGALWDGGGVYSGANVYATYALEEQGWDAYEGRTTPQTYAHSELLVTAEASYYTTNYPSFGGLLSMIKNGQTGAYALSAAYTNRKATSLTVVSGSTDVFVLVAQSVGLTLSAFPEAAFGLANNWRNLAILAMPASGVSHPQALAAGDALFAGYVLDGEYIVRASATPSSIAAAADFPQVGGCGDAVSADLAWDGTDVYIACVSAAGELGVQRAALADALAGTWETVGTAVVGTVDAIDLEGSSSGVSVAVRQGSAIRVFASLDDATPEFDALLPGQFDLARTSEGVVLAVCDLAGSRTLRTFIQ